MNLSFRQNGGKSKILKKIGAKIRNLNKEKIKKIGQILLKIKYL